MACWAFSYGSTSNASNLDIALAQKQTDQFERSSDTEGSVGICMLLYIQIAAKVKQGICGFTCPHSWRLLHGVYPYGPALMKKCILRPIEFSSRKHYWIHTVRYWCKDWLSDQNGRFEYCNFMLNTLQEHPSLLSNILWTDKSVFTPERTVYVHNRHYLAPEKPLISHPEQQAITWLAWWPNAALWCIPGVVSTRWCPLKAVDVRAYLATEFG